MVRQSDLLLRLSGRPTCGTVLGNKDWQAISFVSGNYGPDPLGFAGQAEIMARKVLIELLPIVLADLGFWEGEGGKLVDRQRRRQGAWLYCVGPGPTGDRSS